MGLVSQITTIGRGIKVATVAKNWLQQFNSTSTVVAANPQLLSHSGNILIENPSKLSEEHQKCLAKDLVIKEDFISEAEEESLLKEVSVHLKRLRYQKDHWDDAIHDFREIERSSWSEPNQLIIDRIRHFSFPTTAHLIGFVHVLDISANGYIKPHIDSVRYCGDTISGISLLSDAVMKLIHKDEKDCVINLFLPRRSLYILRGVFRHEFTHEVMEDSKSYFGEKHVPRARRISVICRNEA